MATDETLNFVSASESLIAHVAGMQFHSATPHYAAAHPEYDYSPAANFTNLNLGIQEPITSSENFLGYSDLIFTPGLTPFAGDTNYANVGSVVADANTFVGSWASGLPGLASILNTINLKRNGPYQHPTWKQIRGGEHPVARYQRLRNTVSVDQRNPKHIVKSVNMDNYGPEGSPAFHTTVFSGSVSIQDLKQFYEPVVVSKYKPFLYDVPINVGNLGTVEQARARQSLFNQMTYFSNDDLNDLLKFSNAAPNPPAGYTVNNQKVYSLFHAAKDLGSGRFIFHETIYPRGINTYRKYKLEKPNYEEVAGYGSNGYDRNHGLIRSFWRDTQYSTTSSSRLRTIEQALSTQDVTQSMSYAPSWENPMDWQWYKSGIIHRFDANGDLAIDAEDIGIWTSGSSFGENMTGAFGEGAQLWYWPNGIVMNQFTTAKCFAIDTTSSCGPVTPTAFGGTTWSFGHMKGYVQQDPYQPYQINLNSAWPLDAHVYDMTPSSSVCHPGPACAPSCIDCCGVGCISKPIWTWEYYTIGANADHIGLTPHASDLIIYPPDRGDSFTYWTSMHGGYTPEEQLWLSWNPENPNPRHFITRSAGELAYSTKPTIFFYRQTPLEVTQLVSVSASIWDPDWDDWTDTTGSMYGPIGYAAATASIQYLRHTYPYQSPWWVTNLVANRNPMFDTYADFIGNDLKYIARDYSILPEFRISEHFDYYDRYFRAYKSNGHIKVFTTAEAFDESLGRKVTRVKRNFGTQNNPFSPEIAHKLDFLTLHGVETTSSSDLVNLEAEDLTTTRYTYDDLGNLLEDPDNINNAKHYRNVGSNVVFNQKFVHTDDIKNFTYLIQNKGFNQDVVPGEISFECDSIKKLLPYEGFYPMTRTTQIGSYFKKAFEDYIAEGYSSTNSEVSAAPSHGLGLPAWDLLDADFSGSVLGIGNPIDASPTTGMFLVWDCQNVFEPFCNTSDNCIKYDTTANRWAACLSGNLSTEQDRWIQTAEKYKGTLEITYKYLTGGPITDLYDPTGLNLEVAEGGAGENLSLQYSEDGTTWSFLASHSPSLIPTASWNDATSSLTTDIPVYIRWHAYATSHTILGGAHSDHWALDDILIRGEPSAFNSLGAPSGQSLDSKNQAMMQSLLEPFFAPGLLYNSIKSGIAVDYPVYLKNAPVYYTSCMSASHAICIDHPDGMPDDLTLSTGSFGHGGYHMMGIANAMPAYLKSAPDYRMPFEALYDMNKLAKLHISDANKNPFANYLVSDFLWGSGSLYGAGNISEDSSVHVTALDSASLDYQPNVRLKQNPAYLDTTELNLYESAINNFLAETMEFYLEPYDKTINTKFPIIVSRPRHQLQATTPGFTYYMDLKLEMGVDQVMCEGPRRSNFIYSPNIPYAEGPLSSSLRGYLYGPPIEVVSPTEDSTLSAIGNKTGVGHHYELNFHSALAANLSDPAYQPWTPPYFYGNSHITLAFKPNSATTPISDAFQAIETSSYYFEQYNIEDGLTPKIPTTASTAQGSFTRMKIDASIDIFNELLEVEDPTYHSDKIKKIWYAMPKWVCPVLDFSSSHSGYYETVGYTNNNERKLKLTTINNPYHDETTGKSMWGGYGTDPYDPSILTVNLASGAPLKSDKGIYFSLAPTFPGIGEDTLETAGFVSGLESDEGYFVTKESTMVKPTTGSLAERLGLGGEGSAQKSDIRFEIGKMASKKTIREAIAIVPYFDEPIDLAFITEAYNQPVDEATNFSSNLSVLGGIFKTRQIIPGKHFLGIHNLTFEKILNVILTEKFYKGNSLKYKQLTEHWLTQENNNQSTLSNALSCDVGNMISTLIGHTHVPGSRGYQLPPEFDFIHNKDIGPFQMMIVPFEHQLNKQDLINIYQGIMPDISLRAEKAFSSVVTHPGTEHAIDDPNLIPSFIRPGSSTVSRIMLTDFNLANFLSPLPLVRRKMIEQVLTAGGQGSVTSKPTGVTTAKEFYEKMKFMVFKIKQRAVSNYKRYKEKNLSMVIESKILPELTQGDDVSISNLNDSSNVFADEIYGPNWPYDNFSLIEAAKMDIKIKVD